jgi:hypothetical protein
LFLFISVIVDENGILYMLHCWYEWYDMRGFFWELTFLLFDHQILFGLGLSLCDFSDGYMRWCVQFGELEA